MAPARSTTHTRATDADSEGRVVQLVRSSWFMLVTPALLTIIFAAGCWWFSSVNAKLEAVSVILAKIDKANDLLDARVKSLEDTRTSRNGVIDGISKDIADLKLQVGLLRAGVRVPESKP